ncbi:MAG: 1-acyl-sn-glycerol-3-phosphate acyltransferase [Magnetococcales bacterium]|nr:1-acyl-sn-glycerol-3-phosphate acyltransferase [Magnetococcales bacterium]MBF0116827.1 1-acyl-sn-glycerol-3-phosphate acyltransferase [Magnetococcales bacterium]
MNAIRSGLFFVLFVLGIMAYATVIVTLWPITSLTQRRRLACSWAQYNRRILALCCGLRDRFIGQERLPPPPYVILCKHQSAWETVTLHAQFPIFVLVLKKSLLYIPFFGWALKATGQIVIDRQREIEALRTLQEQSKRQCAEGTSILIFPEGTRVAAGEVGHYHAGGILMAMSAGVPIVPVAHNAGTFWARRSFVKKPGEIQVRIGQPIPTQGLDKTARKQLLQQVQASIEGMMAEIDADSAAPQNPPSSIPVEGQTLAK